jgi:hypothetical protein
MKPLKPSLELPDEIDLHRIGWIAQRIGWAILFLILIAAVFGLFGSGLLSEKKLSADGNSVTFERFGRFQSPMTLEVFVKENRGLASISLPQSYLDHLELQQIQPQPSAAHINQQSVTFEFKTDQDISVRFYLIPETPGKLVTGITVNQSLFSLSHFIYP